MHCAAFPYRRPPPLATSAMADNVPQETRKAFGDITNGGSQLDGDDKHRRASTEGQRVLHWLHCDFAETCDAPLCVFPQRLITDDDDAVICEGCAKHKIYHAKCACIRPDQMPAKWWCEGCSAAKKAKAVAAEKAALKKDGDPDWEEASNRRGSRKRPAANGNAPRKRGTPEDGPRKKHPCEMPPDERAAHEPRAPRAS